MPAWWGSNEESFQFTDGCLLTVSSHSRGGKEWERESGRRDGEMKERRREGGSSGISSYKDTNLIKSGLYPYDFI